jgi:hypothetical protein
MGICLRKKKEENLRGDKLRELILWVYLHNKFEKDKIRMAFLREKVGYHGPGGLYSAINSSGYFDKKNDEITLTQKGVDYLNKQILPQYKVFNPVGNFLVILGLVFLLQWYFWTYLNSPMVIPWYSAIICLAAGIFVRVFFMRLSYWIMKHSKKKA